MADYAGYLQKTGQQFTARKQTRYVELRGPMLYFWESKPRQEEDHPIGSMNIEGAKIEEYPKLKFAWTVQPAQSHKDTVFVGTSLQERNNWMEKMRHPNLSNTKLLQVVGGDGSDDDEGTTVFSAEKKTKVSLSDFEAISVIGCGSFGKVFHVRKKGGARDETYAMKEMNKEVVERENLTAHIFAEKSILQTIHHPFIVKLHYAFQTKDRIYLVLDLLSGGELFFHLGKVGTFPEQQVKFYVAQIGLALGYLHSLNIIYRDLKPENAVLDKDGFVCLTDFGLAKENVEGAGASTFCGTPEYLAPEFLLGSSYGRAVDWWSLGILMYEMLFGIPPYYDQNQVVMYELILTAPLQFDSEIAVSEDAKNLLQRLLERDPVRRLQDVDEFKRHPFFRDMDFERLYKRQVTPPFKPDSDVLNNFDSQFTEQDPIVMGDNQNGAEYANLVGFTYEGDRPAPAAAAAAKAAPASKSAAPAAKPASPPAASAKPASPTTHSHPGAGKPVSPTHPGAAHKPGVPVASIPAKKAVPAKPTTTTAAAATATTTSSSSSGAAAAKGPVVSKAVPPSAPVKAGTAATTKTAPTSKPAPKAKLPVQQPPKK